MAFKDVLRKIFGIEAASAPQAPTLSTQITLADYERDQRAENQRHFGIK